MARFVDIPEFTKSSEYMVNVSLEYLPRHYARYVVEYGLDVSPDFQRAYVWTTDQKIKFIEYMLRGGQSGRDIYMNCPNWKHGSLSTDDPKAWFVLVDGKQRIDAALGFLNNEFPAFGHLRRDYTDKPDMIRTNFRWHVNDLSTYAQVLRWYVDLNSGGTVHSDTEINRVLMILEAGEKYVRPIAAHIAAHANLERYVLQDALRKIREEDERMRETLRARRRRPLFVGSAGDENTPRDGESTINVGVSFYPEDIERLELLVERWRAAGLPYPGKSMLVRVALELLEEKFVEVAGDARPPMVPGRGLLMVHAGQWRPEDVLSSTAEGATFVRFEGARKSRRSTKREWAVFLDAAGRVWRQRPGEGIRLEDEAEHGGVLLQGDIR